MTPAKRPRGMSKDIKMSFPESKLEDATHSLRQSILNEKNVKRLPDEDQATSNPRMELVYARRELNFAQERLVRKRVEEKERAIMLDNQWKYLTQKEHELKLNFIKFNKFLRENQEKRDRAERKIIDEQTLQVERQGNLDSLNEQFLRYLDIKRLMEKKIREYRLYEDYLQTVVKSGTDFKNVTAILMRFEALREAKFTSSEKHEREICAVDEARSKMLRLVEDKNMIILGLRSRAAVLSSRFEQARKQSLSCESNVIKVSHEILVHYRNHRMVRNCADTLYRQMCARKKMKPATYIIRRNAQGVNVIEGVMNFEHQMMFIKQTLNQLHRLRANAFGGGKKGRGGATKKKKLSIAAASVKVVINQSKTVV